jgi:hypothetical protein
MEAELELGGQKLELFFMCHLYSLSDIWRVVSFIPQRIYSNGGNMDFKAKASVCQ